MPFEVRSLGFGNTLQVSTGSVFAVNDTVATKPQTVRDARGTTVFIRGVLKGGLGQVERWKHPEGPGLHLLIQNSSPEFSEPDMDAPTIGPFHVE